MSTGKATEADFRSGCPVCSGLDIVGDKWTLLIVRDMALGKQTFKDFSSSPEGIATNILSDRLKRLEGYGLVSKAKLEGNRRVNVYSLTDKGLGLLPVLVEVGRWGDRYLGEDNPSLVRDAFARLGSTTEEIVRNMRAGLPASSTGDSQSADQ